MKRISLYLACCLVFLVVGCKKDESFVYNEALLIGTWKAVECNGAPVEAEAVNAYIFGADGRAVYGRWKNTSSERAEWVENTFNYKCKEKQVVLANSNTRFVLEVTQLTETSLQCKMVVYISHTDESGGDYSSYIYKRTLEEDLP